MSPFHAPDPSLPAKVIEVRCPCGRSFSIRTKQAKMQKLCNKCQRTYVARIYLNGVVTIHFMAPMGFIEQEFERTSWSDVTEGE